MSDDTSDIRKSWKGPAPAEEEAEQERQELKAAGWDCFEEALGKSFWKKPDSGHLYPQDTAIAIVRSENGADDGGGDLL